MSDITTDNLVEEARGYIASGELSSTPYEDLLAQDLKFKDYDSLWNHIVLTRDFLRLQDEVESERVAEDVY